MFERFDDDARKVIVHAQEESRLLLHDYVGTEHILLGLLGEGTVPSHVRQPTAKAALASLDISLEAARRQVRNLVGEGLAAPAAHIPFTPRAKHALALALDEALERGEERIGTGTLLLGLVREGTGIGTQVLERLGAGPDRVRRAVDRVLAERGSPSPASVPAVRLRPMRDDEWDAWRAVAVREYAEVMQRNKALTHEQALARAEQENTALLPEGADTPGHYFFVAEDADSGRRIGHLWFARALEHGPAVAWLYDIYVEREDRGKGHGRAMIRLMEDEARAVGLGRIELNVFGDNEAAKRLYASTGYTEISRQMGKDLDT
jgi:ribosomal protein S18 acetylase RimI-like enzyme